jgi:hypothetical protein
MTLRPHDPVPQLAVPVDPWTGWPLPPATTGRLHRYREAERHFRLTLHELDGTTEGTLSGDARMQKAFERLDETTHWVLAMLLDHRGQ